MMKMRKSTENGHIIVEKQRSPIESSLHSLLMDWDFTEKRRSLIECRPVKRFFVEMLTRDIDLRDAIMDLLDNCIDGMMRKTLNDREAEKPYKGFKAKITFNEKSFGIWDNCGGIPKETAIKYAFRMGRPQERVSGVDGSTIGMYGIGMKRAVFKMGKNVRITTRCGDDGCYETKIDRKWLEDDGNWNLPIGDCTEKLDVDGTSIYISELYDGIKEMFSYETGNFRDDLVNSIGIHYGTIIGRGFEVYVNGEPVKPKMFNLRINKNRELEKEGLFPYIFEEKSDHMEISFIVGIAGPTPDYENMEMESEKGFSFSNAGWTVVCNDRVVVQADKSRVTGWGDANPAFHYQFNSIVGVVEFKSKNPFELPITTTKKGIDTSSNIYLHIRKQMMIGLRTMVDYTNEWKNRKGEEKESVLKDTEIMSIEEIKTKIVEAIGEKNLWQERKDGEFAFKLYKPNLPKPETVTPEDANISFRKKKTDIETVKNYLMDYKWLDENADRRKVGSKCFDYVIKSGRHREFRGKK